MQSVRFCLLQDWTCFLREGAVAIEASSREKVTWFSNEVLRLPFPYRRALGLGLSAFHRWLKEEQRRNRDRVSIMTFFSGACGGIDRSVGAVEGA